MCSSGQALRHGHQRARGRPLTQRVLFDLLLRRRSLHRGVSPSGRVYVEPCASFAASSSSSRRHGPVCSHRCFRWRSGEVNGSCRCLAIAHRHLRRNRAFCHRLDLLVSDSPLLSDSFGRHSTRLSLTASYPPAFPQCLPLHLTRWTKRTLDSAGTSSGRCLLCQFVSCSQEATELPGSGCTLTPPP